MLADAIKSLLGSEKHSDHEEKQTDININIPVLIPEELISDVNYDLFYRRISNAKTRKSWTKFLMNCGSLWISTNFNSEFIGNNRSRNRSTELGIEKIRFNKEYGRIYFNENPMIDVSHVKLTIQMKIIDYTQTSLLV